MSDIIVILCFDIAMAIFSITYAVSATSTVTIVLWAANFTLFCANIILAVRRIVRFKEKKLKVFQTTYVKQKKGQQPVTYSGIVFAYDRSDAEFRVKYRCPPGDIRLMYCEELLPENGMIISYCPEPDGNGMKVDICRKRQYSFLDLH